MIQISINDREAISSGNSGATHLKSQSQTSKAFE
jgi:hypothetical protein